MKRPFCVVLTGGAGCGKSLVSSAFAKLGIEVIDTDVIARELTVGGGEAMARILRDFGTEYLLADGGLDRKRMRAAVFADPDARGRLEAILHPMIHSRACQRLDTSKTPYVILVVPLFVEGDAYRGLADRVLVVDCKPEQQVQRIMQRDGVSESMARAILVAQASRASRLAVADDVLDNTGEPAAVEAGVERLHRLYTQAAAKSVC